MARAKEFEEVVGSIPKNNGDEIRVTALTTKSGEPYIDIRNYYTDDEGEKQPTKKGIRFHAEMTEEVMGLIKGGLDLIDERLAVKSRK